jgi:LmbE family N-acetylglucosaminyl deacetylase
MMKPCSSAYWNVFVKANISPHLIFLTAGELGIPTNSKLLPPEMAQVRAGEAVQAMKVLKASYTLLTFPDLHLPFIPFETLVSAVLPIIRGVGSDGLFSFDPYDNQPEVDHPDHAIAGMVAKYVGASANVSHLKPEHPSPAERPELYLWTSEDKEKNHVLPLTRKARRRRNQYLIKNHPSQFQAAEKKNWIPVFNRITHTAAVTGPQHRERYIKVR